MRLPYALYAIGFGFITAGFVMEIREQQKRGAVWHKVTLDGNDSSLSQSSPQQQPSQPTASE